MMNRYSTRFTVKCPVNGKMISYDLVIETCGFVKVEDILDKIGELPETGYHESIADLLAAALPGRQTMRAHHHGVDIETVRGAV